MRHNRDQIKLGRDAAHRRALFRNLLSSLFEHGSIITTDAKARELKRRADRLIAMAREDTVHHRRIAAAELSGPAAVWHLFERWGRSLQDRGGGFTRSVKIGQRQGDGAPLTLVEIIGARAEKTPE